MLFVRQASTPIFPELSRSRGTVQSQEYSPSSELRGGPRRRSVKESTSWLTDNGSWRHRSSPAPYIEDPPRNFKPRPLRVRDGGHTSSWASNPMVALIHERKEAEELERRIQCVKGAFSKSMPSFTQPAHLRKRPVLSARLEELAKPREDKWLENETVESVVKATPPRPKPPRRGGGGGRSRVPALPPPCADASTDENKSPLSSMRERDTSARQSLQLQDDVRFTMTLQNVRYTELTQDGDLLTKFERAVKMGVAAETFDKVLPEHISLGLRADQDNVAVHTTISPPSGVTTDALASKIRYSLTLGQEVSHHLSAVAGVEAITSGPIRVTGISGPEVVAPGTSQREHSGIMWLTPTAGGTFSPNISTHSSREASLETRKRSKGDEAKTTLTPVPDFEEQLVTVPETSHAERPLAASAAVDESEGEEGCVDVTEVAQVNLEGEGIGDSQPVAVTTAKSAFSDGFEESEDDSRESAEDAAAASQVSAGAKQPKIISAVTYGDFEGSEGSESGDDKQPDFEGSEGSESGDGKQPSLPHSAYDSEDDFEDEESEQASSMQPAAGKEAAGATTGGPAAVQEPRVEDAGHEDYEDGDDFESDDD